MNLIGLITFMKNLLICTHDINPSAFKCHYIPQLRWHHIQSTFIPSIKFILLDDIQQCKFISSGWITFIHQISCHHINSFTFSKRFFWGGQWTPTGIRQKWKGTHLLTLMCKKNTWSTLHWGHSMILAKTTANQPMQWL
jgi:hypothetical protein